MTPREARRLMREGRWTGPTAGLCPDYVQANLVVLPKAYAYDFLLFCQRNPKPCPLLEVAGGLCRVPAGVQLHLRGRAP